MIGKHCSSLLGSSFSLLKVREIMVHLLISGIIDLKNVKSCDMEKTLDSVALRWKNLAQRAGAIGSQRNCPERGLVTSSV